MHDGIIRILNDVRHIPDMRKNLIFLGTLHANSFNYRSDNDKEILRVTKGVLTVMKGKWTTENIYKLLGNTIVGGAAAVESDYNKCIKL